MNRLHRSLPTLFATLLALPAFAIADPPEPVDEAAELAIWADSRDDRMAWWRDARLGMFVHWGLYSPAGGMWDGKVYPQHYAEWIQNWAAVPCDEYARKMKPLFRPDEGFADEWADPTLGTGCVKITPAHDPNDYDVWQRHQQIGAVNMLNPDGTVSKAGGKYAGMDRFEARAQVLQDLDALGLLDRIEDRQLEVDHSDRSKTVIEPYLSKQWFVTMGDVDGGVVMGRGTDKEFRSAGLAQAALDATAGALPAFADGSPRRQVAFHPDPERYRNMHDRWLGEKRDWCISRQLWWGHRIPVWRGDMETPKLLMLEPMLQGQLDRDDVCAWILLPDGSRLGPTDAFQRLKGPDAPASVEVQLCFLEQQADDAIAPMLQGAGLELDPDVLDTWFSSALWPFSTLGWPEDTDRLRAFYPTSCLVTGFDIIFFWVARMIMMTLHLKGEVPFKQVYVHGLVRDGEGQKMSKSKGNVLDPIDLIDGIDLEALVAKRTSSMMQPKQAQKVEKATRKQFPDGIPGYGTDALRFTFYSLASTGRDIKFDLGRMEGFRNFCNKLWNASRYVLMNTETFDSDTASPTFRLADRWIRSRLQTAITETSRSIEQYRFDHAAQTLYDFVWNEYCDWYLELSKPVLWNDEASATEKQGTLLTLLDVLETVLRLLHPMMPFISEDIWLTVPSRLVRRGDAHMRAPWPNADQDQNDAGGDDLPQRSRCRHRPGGQLFLIAAAQHGGQGQKPHGDHGGADDAGARGQQHAYDGHRDTQPAGPPAKQQRHIAEQILGYLCPLKDVAHQYEQRHGNEGFVTNGAEYPGGYRRQVAGIEHPGEAAQGGKYQSHPSQGQCHREPCHQDQANDQEHE